MTKNKTTEAVLLTVSELKAMGSQLNDALNDLEKSNLIIEGLEVAKKHKPEVFDLLIHRFFETECEQNRQLFKLLDDIAVRLLVCDNERELEGYRQ